MKSLRHSCVLVTVAAAVLVPHASAHAAPSTTYGVGIPAGTALPTPTNDRQPIYVSTQGTDDGGKREYCLNGGSIYKYTCVWPSASKPLRNIQTAIDIAEAGDVILVRGGSYVEDLGYKAPAGTSTRPVNLWAYPGEKVYMRGHLNLRSAHHWTVRGFRFLDAANDKVGTVHFMGGYRWSFINNEVAGSDGYANVTVSPVPGEISNVPKYFVIAGNCIHDALGQYVHGQAHNLYLQTGKNTVRESGGTIHHNLFFNALEGSNIKVGPGGTLGDAASPYSLTITRNTMLTGATGMVFGRNAAYNTATYNIIGMARNQDAWDGGVKLWDLKYSSTNSYTNGIIRDYKYGLRTTGSSAPGFKISVVKPAPSLAYTGSLKYCTASFTDPTTKLYGHRS